MMSPTKMKAVGILFIAFLRMFVGTTRGGCWLRNARSWSRDTFMSGYYNGRGK